MGPTITTGNNNNRSQQQQQSLIKMDPTGNDDYLMTSSSNNKRTRNVGNGNRSKYLWVFIALCLGGFVYAYTGYFVVEELDLVVEGGEMTEEEEVLNTGIETTTSSNNKNNKHKNKNKNKNKKEKKNNTTSESTTTNNNNNNLPAEEVEEEEEVVAPTTKSSVTKSTETSSNTKNNNNNNNNDEGPPSWSISSIPGSTTTIENVDLLDRSQLLELANQQKQALLSKLYVDYGQDNFEKMFLVDPNNGRRYRDIISSVDGDISVTALKRKFQIKVLQVQVEIMMSKKSRRRRKTKKKASSSGSTTVDVDVDIDDEGLLQQRNLRLDPHNNNIELDDIIEYTTTASTNTNTKFVWATGGHSASAGHGNMYNESYTAYMSRDLVPYFAKFGIDFVARNYAMGGTQSGYEISSCYPQIFGYQDVDIFSWDYGMTTGKNVAQIMHYAYRAALSNANPTFVGLRLKHGSREMHLLTERGLAAFTLQDDDYSELIEAIPDSAGKTDAEIDEMPFYVRNLKCGTSIESGDPYCKEEKYTKYYCEDRGLRVHWHPGFKAHAIDGHILSLFLMQTFMDALKDLSDNDEKDPEILLDQLKQEDMKLIQKFADSPMFDATDTKLKSLGFYGKSKDRSFDLEHKDLIELLFKGDSICRTGRTPSRSRYLGYMTKSGKIGDIAALGNETYYVGINSKEAKETAAESNEEMRLVWEEGKSRNWECTGQILKPDYKDFWVAHHNDGLVKFPAFPNEKEKEVYGYNESNFKGLLVIKLGECSWGKCNKKEVRLGEGKAGDQGDSPLENGNLEMTVNGEKVVSYLPLDDLIALVGENGRMYWEPRASGDYEIEVRVNEEDKYFRIMSIVLY